MRGDAPACEQVRRLRFLLLGCGVMAKKTTKNKKGKDEQVEAEIRAAMNQPWLSMRSGFILITLTSILMAVFTAWQVWPSMEWWKAIGWGLIFGGAIWLVFFGGILFNRFMRRGSK